MSLETSGSRRFALLLEYDGTRFAGSQLQSNARTVQGELERAIERVTGGASRVGFAGRTDGGVHALGQVASFLSETRLEASVLRRALNACLPEDISVRDAAEVSPDLDVRRNALRRQYRYLIYNTASRPALLRARAWHVASPLDMAAMVEAARGVIGRHDFAAFASRLEREGASSVRELYRFEVGPAIGAGVEAIAVDAWEVAASGFASPDEHGTQLVAIDAVANGFLPHQVRRMVGALVEVGKGRLRASEYAGLLERPAASVGPGAPAHGLYMMGVEYDLPLFGAASNQ